MRALLLSFLVLGVGLRSAQADDDPPPPDPGTAVAPDAPPLAPLPPASSSPPPAAPAPQWGATLPPIQLDPYPEALVDRPLTLLPGMTEVSASYDMASTTDDSFNHRTPDIGARHAFETFEVRANLGTLGSLSAAIPTGGFPAVVVIGGESGAPQPDHTMHLGQFVDVEHKIHVAPGSFAIFLAAGASYNENRLHDPFAVLTWTHVLVASADGELELQLLPTLALDVGLSFQWAAESSQDLTRTTVFDANASLMATVGHSWDLYFDGGLGDVGTSNLPFLSFGFAKRWGE